jgi:hypothetical protein
MSRCARATSALPYPEPARTPRRRKTPRSEAGAVATVDLRLMTRASGLGRCHAASLHSPAGERPSTIGRRPAARRYRLRAHADAPVGHEARPKPPRRVVESINPLFFPRARPSNTAVRRRPPLAPPVNSHLRSRP